MLNRTCKHTCASKNTYVEIFMFVQRKFCNDKRITVMLTHSRWEWEKKFQFYFTPLFSVLIVLVYAWLSGGGEMCLSFETEEKKSGPMIQRLDVGKHYVDFICYWDRLGSLYCVVMLACRP